MSVSTAPIQLTRRNGRVVRGTPKLQQEEPFADLFPDWLAEIERISQRMLTPRDAEIVAAGMNHGWTAKQVASLLNP